MYARTEQLPLAMPNPASCSALSPNRYRNELQKYSRTRAARPNKAFNLQAGKAKTALNQHRYALRKYAPKPRSQRTNAITKRKSAPPSDADQIYCIYAHAQTISLQPQCPYLGNELRRCLLFQVGNRRTRKHAVFNQLIERFFQNGISPLHRFALHTPIQRNERLSLFG